MKNKVVAFAPIPVLHTNKYEMEQTPDISDVDLNMFIQLCRNLSRKNLWKIERWYRFTI